MDEKLTHRRQKSGGFRRVIAWLCFFLLTIVVVNLPDHPDAITVHAFLRLPLEIPALITLLLVLGGRAGQALRSFATLCLGCILFLKLADLGTQSAFQRPFNPYLDVKMMADGWNLLSGSVGMAIAATAVVGLMLIFVSVLVAFQTSMQTIAATPPPIRKPLLVAFAILSLAGASFLFGNIRLPSPLEANAGSYLITRSQLVAGSIKDMAAFDLALSTDADLSSDRNLFPAVAGRDVILIFVESYGRSAIDDPRYAPTIRPRLAGMEQALGADGIAMASGWVTSPTVAGLSWLAHGTFLSGLWLDNQARYDRLLMSRRKSLNRLFAEAGWESVAVMPAITMDWPEAAYFGYDRILAAKDLGYQGKPFNWVTMPDQYTLSAFQRMVRDRAPRKPVMAEIALISSHAPWTPVAHLIDWQAIDDGTVFDTQAESGPSPQAVWADAEQVRHHYIRTIDYSLETIGSYIKRFGDNALFIVIGDHQPAALVTGANASRAVPIHVFSRDTAVIQRFIAANFASGLLPGAAREVPMSQMRGQIIDILGR